MLEVIRSLHALAQGGHSGDAGDWKRRDNESLEILPKGDRRIRLVPTPARETPKVIGALCRSYREACDQERIPPLLIAATFVFDFLCVHPFRDGNGRVSRLLTTLLLKSHGFEVGRYISLERLAEERKDEYYGVLRTCSEGWHEGTNEILPWWNYFLSVLREGYREFERQVKSTGLQPAKSALVRSTILGQAGRFTLADLSQQAPRRESATHQKSTGGVEGRREDPVDRERAGGVLGTQRLSQTIGRDL